MTDKNESSPPQSLRPERNVKCIADECLLDAMLKGHFQDSPETTKERIDLACQSLEAASRLRPWQWRAGLSAVAAIIILGFIIVLTAPQNVQADLAPILAAFDQGDKTYQIEISSDSNQPSHSPQRPGRRHFGRRHHFRSPHRGMKARILDGASLYIRGRNYVLTCRGPRGGTITKGFDGQEKWVVTPWGTSLRGQERPPLQANIPDHISSLLFLDLRDTLHQIQENYTLSGPSLGSIDGEGNQLEYYVAGRIERRSKLPQRIELWFDITTNQLQQIICTGVAFHSPKTPRYTLDIKLVDTAPLPDNWFTQAAHTPESNP